MCLFGEGFMKLCPGLLTGTFEKCYNSLIHSSEYTNKRNIVL